MGDQLLRLGNPIAAVLFDQVRIAHAGIGVRVVEQDLRLRPVDKAVFLDAAGDPDRITSDVLQAGVIVKPEEVIAVLYFHKRGHARGVLIARPPGSYVANAGGVQVLPPSRL